MTSAPRRWTAPLRLLLLPLLWLMLSQSTQAASSALERWLEQEALPVLAERLQAHPRLAGEPLQVTAGNSVAASAPRSRSTGNALEESLVDSVGRSLRDYPGIHLTARSRGPCPLSHGVELRIQLNDGHPAEVRLDFLDVREARWLTGLGVRWTGMLSHKERRQLQQAPSPGGQAPGSPANPLPVEDLQAIAAALARQSACSLPPSGPALPAPTALHVPPELSALEGPLRAHLSGAVVAAWEGKPASRDASGASAVGSGRGPASSLHLKVEALGARSTGEVPGRSGLTLHLDARTGSLQQRLATVQLSAPGRAITPQAHDPRGVFPRAAGTEAGRRPLTLSATPAPRQGACYNHNGPCVALSFDLYQPQAAALLMSYGPPDKRRLRYIDCDDPIRLRSAGAQQLRLALPAQSANAANAEETFGFYLLTGPELSRFLPDSQCHLEPEAIDGLDSWLSIPGTAWTRAGYSPQGTAASASTLSQRNGQRYP